MFSSVRMGSMTQLDLVNVDMTQGIYAALGLCTSMKTLLIKRMSHG